MSYRDAEIHLSAATAEALDALNLVTHVGEINAHLPEMAWLWFVLQHVDDSPQVFPRGKYATLQHMEAQLIRCADWAGREYEWQRIDRAAERKREE